MLQSLSEGSTLFSSEGQVFFNLLLKTQHKHKVANTNMVITSFSKKLGAAGFLLL